MPFLSEFTGELLRSPRFVAPRREESLAAETIYQNKNPAEAHK
jgi:hypothetical protein